MAVTNHEVVGRCLAALAKGLGPFVERECRAHYGADWASQVLHRPQGGVQTSFSTADVQFQLKVVWDEWNAVFSKKLSRSDRTLVSELRETRNRWAHQEPFGLDDADRAVDSCYRLLTAVAAGEEAQEVERWRKAVLRARFERETKRETRKAASAPVEGRPAGGLAPWREVVFPHPDVAAGRYLQAEFAADLHQVWRGEAAGEYGDPAEFFRRTFLTEGLRGLLINAARRFAGKGGEPVIELQTNFGGGKTHSLIALYHLAAGLPPSDLAGVAELLGEESLTAPSEANRAVIVGHQISPGVVQVKDDGTEINTLWGEIAWQLAGRDGYELVAEADRTRTNPGHALVELLTLTSPCLILIDEWVAYARQLYGVDGLPAGSFDAQFTFAQTLAEAARAVQGALLVVSIPSSDIEVGGEGGQQSLTRLKNVIGRVESSWRPASAEESFEIVRRRLFDDLPPDNAPKRDRVVRAFGDLYRSNSASFPTECARGDYDQRLASAYPIHPEVFDRLYSDWSTLDRFQRTRGVLRLMAQVIHTLWRREDKSLLIMPSSLPMDDRAVSAELTRYLEDGWPPVIESDVDGPQSLPLKIDGENPALGRYSAARRVARTIYMGSAPTQAAANRGIDDRRITLGCAQPGEAPATFGDALRRLADRATYLYGDGSRYWFQLQPTVAKLARDRAASMFTDDDADDEIRARLGTAAASRGDFRAVHPAPRGPADVPDEDETRLVILGPEAPHDAKVETSHAREAAERILLERGAGDRRYRNMLVFLAADAPRLEELRQGARRFLAWRSIDAERSELNLDTLGSNQVTNQLRESSEAVVQRIGETYAIALIPGQQPDEPTGPLTWETLRVTGGDPLAVRVSRKLVSEEHLYTGYSGVRLRMDLDRVPLWRGDHVGVRQLWEDCAQYLYLPRLTSVSVLRNAIENGVSALDWRESTFGYADAWDEEAGRYRGLVAGQQPPAVATDGRAVVVQPEVAAAQLVVPAEGDAPEPTDAEDEPTDPEDGDGTARGLPKRFYGRKRLDTVRLTRDVADLADGIVNVLANVEGARVEVVVEIQATAAEGFGERVRMTVDENARTLRLETSEFEST